MIKLTLESLDGIPKELAAEYKQMEDGTFRFSPSFDDENYGVDNLSDIRGKLAAAESKNGKLNERIQGYAKPNGEGDLYTIEEIQALGSKIEELMAENGTLKDKTKTADEKMQELVAQAKGPLERALAETQTELKGYKEKAISSAKASMADRIVEALDVKDEWKPMIRQEVMRHIGGEDADGDVSTFIVNPETGTKRFSSLTGNNDAMGWEEFAKGESIRSKFGQCLNGDGKQGAGIQRQAAPSNTQQPQVKQIVMSAADASNIKAYEAAKAQAAEQGAELVING